MPNKPGTITTNVGWDPDEMKKVDDQMARDNFKHRATWIKWVVLKHLRRAARASALTVLAIAIAISPAAAGMKDLASKSKLTIINFDGPVPVEVPKFERKLALEMTRIIDNAFKDRPLKDLQAAAEGKGWAYGINEVEKSRDAIYDAVIGKSGSSPIADLTSVYDQLNRIIIKSENKQDFQDEVNDLAVMIDEIFYQAKLSTQQGMDPERIKDMKREAEEVEERARRTLGAAVFTSCTVEVIE